MAVEPRFAQWLGLLGEWTEGEARIESDVVFVRAREDASDWKVGLAPPDAELEIDGIARKGSVILWLGAEERPPERIRVRAGPGMENIQIRTEDRPLPWLQVDLSNTTDSITFDCQASRSPRCLEVTSGRLLAAYDTNRSPEEVKLQDVTVNWNGSGVSCKRFDFAGLVEATNGSLVAEETALSGPVTLRRPDGGQFNLGHVKSDRGDESVRVIIQGGSNLVADVPEGSELLIESGSLSLVTHQTQTVRSINAIKIEGTGTLNLETSLTSPVFKGPPLLALGRKGQIIGGSGSIRLQAMGGYCSGSFDPPLRLDEVSQCEQTQLENVIIYGLDIPDLIPLQGAERVVPLMPRWRRDARRQEDAMFSDEPGTTAATKRAHFWARLQAIVRDTHAPGNIQSQVRYAAARARRRSLSWGRERVLLSLYALLGYGERVFHPLGWLLALSLLTQVTLIDLPEDLCCENAGRFWVGVLKLFVSPLAFFRFVQPPQGTGPLETVAVLATRVLGVLLLFFAISAARRVAKAE